MEIWSGQEIQFYSYHHQEFVAGAQDKAAGEETVEETEREACEADVDSAPEVREVGVVGPVGDAPVDPQPQQDDHHGLGHEEQEELGHDEARPLVVVSLDLFSGEHCVD